MAKGSFLKSLEGKSEEMKEAAAAAAAAGLRPSCDEPHARPVTAAEHSSAVVSP